MSHPVFHIPVVNEALRPQEALLQMFDALADLDAAINTVFTSIAQRATEERSKLHELNKRLAVAKSQVNYVATLSNKATTVLSAPRYPHPDDLKPFVPLLAKEEERHAKHSRYYLEGAPLQAAEGRPPPLDGALGIEVSLYEKNGSDVGHEGLGRLPEHMPYVGGLLLFNSRENPYKAYRVLPREEANLKLRQQRPTEVKPLDSAPETVQMGLLLPSYNAPGVNFVPVSKPVPEMEVPTVLPGLTNVASDANYAIGLQSIAPSAAAALAEILPAVDASAPVGGDLPGAPMSAGAGGLPDLGGSNVAAPPPPPPSANGGVAPPPPPPPGFDGGAAPPPPPPPPGVGAFGGPPPPPPPFAAVGDLDGPLPPPPPMDDGGGDDGGESSNPLAAALAAKSKQLRPSSMTRAEQAATETVQSAPSILTGLMDALSHMRRGMEGRNIGRTEGREQTDDEEW